MGTWELWFDSSQYIRHHSSTIDHATSSTLVSSLHTRTEYFLINPRLLSLLLLPNADADPYISTTNFVGHFVALQQQSLHHDRCQNRRHSKEGTVDIIDVIPKLLPSFSTNGWRSFCRHRQQHFPTTSTTSQFHDDNFQYQ